MRYILSIILGIASWAGYGKAPVVHAGPNDNAPAEVMQFGQLVGHWSCTNEVRQQDGSYKPIPGAATWSWYYILEGFAVQDVWLPDRQSNAQAPMGTNIRTYDADNGWWDVVWSTQQAPAFERYRASYRNGEIHMFAERPAFGSFPRHLMHVTFHNISADHFDWRYEASGLTDGQNWQETSRLACDRQTT